MSPLTIIDKYYTAETPLYNILLEHSRSVADMALAVLDAHPDCGADRDLVYQGAILHDIGIYLTNAPDILCYGKEPYIRHSFLGAEILRNEGLCSQALICERHTGTGISAAEIIKHNLPLPHRDMIPVTVEEEIVAFADKFFTKTDLTRKKSLEEARASVARFGEEQLARFDGWVARYMP